MDVSWQKVEALIVDILRGCHCLVRFIYTDGDNCTSSRHRLYYALRREVTALYAQLHDDVEPRIARIVCVTLHDKFELLNTLGTFNACISSDLTHWLRTMLDRLLTPGHTIQITAGGPAISQKTICEAIPGARVVAGFDSGKFNLKIQDKPALELFTSASLKQARNRFPDYARFLLPGTMLQAAFRIELMTRATRFTVLEIADAVEQWLIEYQHDSGRLGDRFEGRRHGGRPQSPQSNDQEMRGHHHGGLHADLDVAGR
jgi:hypothetical protein